MKLDLGNWKVRLIRSTFAIKDADRLPKSLCTFFWTFIGSVLLIPFSLWGHAINFKQLFTKAGRDSYWPATPSASGVGVTVLIMGGIFGWKLCCTVFPFLHLPTNPGSATYYDMFIDFISLYYYGFIFFILVAIVISAIFGVAWLITKYIDNRKARKEKEMLDKYLTKNPDVKGYIPRCVYMEEEPKKKYFVIEYLKAVKNKMCPIIDYNKDGE